MSCRDNVVRGERRALVGALTRGWVRAAPGRLRRSAWSPRSRALTAVGTSTRRAGPLVAVLPPGRHARVATRGLRRVRLVCGPGGIRYVVAAPRGGAWRLRASAR